MALQTIPGPGLFLPTLPRLTNTPAFTSSVIDATGEKISWMGRVWMSTRGTKSIRRVGFLFGTVTKAGGSGLTVSLQDVSVAAGGPPVPDETQDQTVAIANGDAGFASNLWYRTGTLSADRSVTFGEALAVVVEFDGSGRLGSDAVNFRNVNGTQNQFPGVSLKTASWAAQAVIPNIVLEFDDGTFGTLYGSFVCKDIQAGGSGLSFHSGSTPDEYALDIPLPFPCKAEGVWIMAGVAAVNTLDGEFVLYDGTTAMTGGTIAHDGYWYQAADNTGAIIVPFSQEITLAAQTYRLALKPTTTSNRRLAYFDVQDNGHFLTHPLGTSSFMSQRTDGGSWSTTANTRRPLMGLVLSAFDDGAGGGGLRGNLTRSPLM